jgi:hypothetical protein
VSECSSMSSPNIALWIAFGTAIGAAGKLLDAHIRPEANSKLRSRLIALFVFIEKPSLTNWPEILWSRLRRVVSRIGWFRLPLLLLFLYWLVTTAFYIARRWSGNPPTVSYIKYVMTWADSPFWVVFCASMAVGFGGSLAIGAMTISRFTASRLAISKLAWILFGGTLSLALACVAALIVLLSLGGGYNVLLAIPVGIVAASPLAILIAVLLGLFVLMLIVRMLRAVFTRVLDAASSPATTPFIYASTLIGFATSAFGIAKELLARQSKLPGH